MSVHSLRAVRTKHAPMVGGKAASLGELLYAGHPVPAAFVITADEQALTPALSSQILHLFDELGMNRVAVRSSGVGEDGAKQSWAGQFETRLHVDRDGLLKAIRACWDSAYTARAVAYGSGTPLKLAVLVQHMVYSTVAGVAFSANPITGNKNEVMIEAVYGLGELLVKGLVTPDNIVLNKQTGVVAHYSVAEKSQLMTYTGENIITSDVEAPLQNAPALNTEQLQKLLELVTAIETYYGYVIDIEWAFEQNTLYLLQARPITTL